MSTYTQTSRSLQLTTPLGDDKLLLAEFSGQEALSGLFAFELQTWSTDFSISADQLVGQPVTFQIALSDGQPRYFNGIVSSLAAGPRRNDLRFYRITVVPSFWVLTLCQNCRIFQNQSVMQILETVFQEHGLSNYDASGVQSSPPPLEYCVQYNESDFAFLSRLLERFGIFYYFTHADGSHTLNLADSNSAFSDTSPSEVHVVYASSREAHYNRITSWEHRYQCVPGQWAQSDYNFIDFPAGSSKTPANNLLTTADSTVPLAQIKEYKRYGFPGLYQKTAEGQPLTESLVEADDDAYETVGGSSHCAFFGTGCKFKVMDDNLAAESGKQYVLSSISHYAQEGAVYPMTASSGEVLYSYQNDFTCFPAGTPFKPARVTRRPSVRGAQTAVVVGPSGEEIYTDQYGRVKVQFFWDREGVRDENSSCWIRCAQSMAGKNWGAMFLPRVGQEVVVDFIDGDPDRPLITGLVYNAGQMPAYTLPDDQTKSYLKTNSTPGGDGFNELRFDDNAGSEQVFLHAQKDQVVRVLNDRTLIVGQEQDGNKVGSINEHVYQDKFSTVNGNRQQLIEKKRELHVKEDQNQKVEGNVSHTIGGDRQEKISGNEYCNIEKDQNLVVSQNRNIKIEQTLSLDVGSDQNEKIGGGLSQNIGGDLQQKVSGGAALKASTIYLNGNSVVIEASGTLSLQAGGSFVSISAAGVQVSGAIIGLNSGGSAGSGSGPNTTDPTAPTDANPTEPTDPDVPDEDFGATTGEKSAPDSLS